METRTVVLVEGASDRVAVLALAARLGRDLAAAGVEVVAMGGVTNVRAHAERWAGRGVRLTGLYDAPEAPQLRRGLVRAGVALEPDLADLADAGFHRCEADLEDELVRALGLAAAEAVVEAAGEGRSLRLLAQMPAQAGWDRAALLRRFLASRGGRKARYAGLFVAALDLDRAPPPLRRLVDEVAPPDGSAPLTSHDPTGRTT